MRRLPGPCLAALLATAALTAACGAKPPDLPNDPKIVVNPALWLNVHPFVTLDLEPAGCCPRGQCQPPRVVESRCLPSVLDNLQKLEQAAEGMKAAADLAEAGRFAEALHCLAGVRRLCPGSGYERCADEAIGQILVRACLEWLDTCLSVPHSSRRVAELLDQPAAAEWHGGWFCGKPACHRVEGPCCPSWCPAEVKLVLPVSVSFDRVPLSVALDGLRAAGVAVVVDAGELSQGGCPDLSDVCVSVNVDRVPLGVVLDMMLRPFGLEPRPEGAAIRVGVPAGHGKGEEGCEEPQAANGSACPKCDVLHRCRAAGIEALVAGLMKACHQAAAAGRHDKAAVLAREAYVLQPAAVEGDPIVYKLHLLARKRQQAAEPQKPACASADVVRVGQVLVVGNHRTPTAVILRHVPLFPGEVLSYVAVEKAEQNLARLHLFDTPPTVTVLDGKGCCKDILITVKEGKTNSLTIGLGINSDAGLCGSIVFNERNFDTADGLASFTALTEGTAFGDLCARAWRLLCAPPTARADDHFTFGVSAFGSLTVDGRMTCCGRTFRVSLRDGLPLVWVVPAADR